MNTVLSDQLFQQFSSLVYNECGINLHDGKKALLQARLNKRLRATGVESYEHYFKFITAKNNNELVHFLDCISTNLTFFFREPQHFEMLNQVLPELIEQKKKDRDHRLRIWSAGCSTGEEPYSLAMSVLPHLGQFEKCDFRILATDISNRALEVALKGVYPEEKVNKVPDPLRKMFFQKYNGRDGSNGVFEVKPVLRNCVTFRRLNLKEAYPFKGPFDYIFCRNVMIYFDKKTQESLVQTMASYLSPGGYLFVGHSESLMGLEHPLTYIRPAVYKRK